jgi:hypothetical protein
MVENITFSLHFFSFQVLTVLLMWPLYYLVGLKLTGVAIAVTAAKYLIDLPYLYLASRRFYGVSVRKGGRGSDLPDDQLLPDLLGSSDSSHDDGSAQRVELILPDSLHGGRSLSRRKQAHLGHAACSTSNNVGCCFWNRAGEAPKGHKLSFINHCARA